MGLKKDLQAWDQSKSYNGNEKVHAMKSLWVVAPPNGMIENHCGPIEGKRHGATMLGGSNLLG